jgi:hypothetical protein
MFQEDSSCFENTSFIMIGKNRSRPVKSNSIAENRRYQNKSIRKYKKRGTSTTKRWGTYLEWLFILFVVQGLDRQFSV